MAVDTWVGRTIGGKYRVDAVIGKGGMGVVLRATHLRLGEPVAIKVLLPAMLDVPGMVARFVREARAASKIKSAHVVRVTDVDTLEDGVPYMVMEFLEGTDLAALRRKEGPFPIQDAVRFLVEACDAIAEAHSLGIVHRDLKPGNLFVARSRDGVNVLKVLDFGISKLDAPDEQDTTKTGQMMGSPKYMSPEQMLSMHDVDGRSDIWSLGAIFYELLTGRPPFVAESAPRICALVLNESPQPPSALRSDLPPELDAVVLRCLEKDPNNRFATVADFVAALRNFAAPELRGHMATPTLLGGALELRTGAPVPHPSASAPELASPVPVTVRGRHSGSWTATTSGLTSNSATRAKVAGAAVVGLLAVVFFGMALRQPHASSAREGTTADPALAQTASATAYSATALVTASAVAAAQGPSDPVPVASSMPINATVGARPPPPTATTPAQHPGSRRGSKPATPGSPPAGAVNPFEGRH